MKHSQEEIINALQVIQDTCKEQQELDPCEHCPLSNKNGNCVLQNLFPEEWNIKPTLSIWKAFK